MAIAPRGSQLRLCYDPNFAAQSAVNVPNNVNTLTAVLQVTAKNHLEPTQTVDEVFDCSGQFKISEAITSRIARLTVEFDASMTVLKGFLRNCLGAGSGTNLTMLTALQFQQPYLTMAVGFADSPIVDAGVLFHSVVVNSMRITQRSRERVRCVMELVGSGDLTAATGLAYPSCTEVTPIYGYDCALTINSVDRMQQNGVIGTATREFQLEYSNNILASDDPFQLADIDITRLERADRRTILYTWKVEGYELDATHTAALTNPRTIWPVVWRIGSAGTNITLTSAEAILTSEAQAQGFDGEAERAVLNLRLEPTLSGSTLPIVGTSTA